MISSRQTVLYTNRILRAAHIYVYIPNTFRQTGFKTAADLICVSRDSLRVKLVPGREETRE